MRPRTMLLMGVAVACGLAASFMTAQYLKNQRAQVLIARHAIDAGTPLADYEALFQVEERAVQDVPPGAVTSLQQLKPKAQDHLIKQSLNAGDVLAVDNIITRNLISTLRPGFTALSVRATPESSFSGLIEPGHHVKVISLRKSGSEKRSIILMKNIRVLAVDSAIDKTMDRKIPNIITLEVDDEEAKKLAQEDGPLTLGLMSGGQADRRGDVEQVAPSVVDDAMKQKVKVLVASKPIPRQTAAKDLASLFTVKEVLRIQLPANHVVSLDELAGLEDHFFVKPMHADEPLSRDYLAKADEPARTPATASSLTIVEGSTRQRVYTRQPNGKVTLVDTFETPVDSRAAPMPVPQPATTIPSVPGKN